MTIKKNIFKLSSTVIAISLSLNVMAAELTTFSAGDTIKASQMNDNFTYLADKIEIASGDSITKDIDCDADTDALVDYLATATFPGKLSLNVSGTCTGTVRFYKNDVSIYNGIITKAIDDDEAVYIDGRTNISFYDTTIASGEFKIRRQSSVKFDTDGGTGVTLPTPIEKYVTGTYDGVETPVAYGYEDNLKVEASSLRISEGTVDNIVLNADSGSDIHFYSKSLVNVYQIKLKNNSTLDSNIDLDVSSYFLMESNSIFDGNNVTISDYFYIKGNSTFDGDNVSISDYFYIEGNSTFKGENLTAGDITIARGAFVGVDDLVSQSRVDVNTNGNLEANNLTATDELTVLKSSMVDVNNSIIAADAYLTLNSILTANEAEITNGSLFCNSGSRADIPSITGSFESNCTSN